MLIEYWRWDTFRDCEGGRPLVTKDVETDTAVGVDVWVIDSSREVDLRRLEWVIGWEVYGKEEDAALEWTIALKVWNLDQSSPLRYCYL